VEVFVNRDISKPYYTHATKLGERRALWGASMSK